MRTAVTYVALLALMVTGCAGSPVRRAVKQSGRIEIATAEPGTVGSARDAAFVKAAAGSSAAVGAAAGLSCGPMALVCSPVFAVASATATLASIAVEKKLDSLATPRAQAVGERMRSDFPPEALLEDIAGAVRRFERPATRDDAAPPLTVTLALSRLELQPVFPSHAQLIVWIDLQAGQVMAGAKPLASRRHAYLGNIHSLQRLEQDPGLLEREFTKAKAELAGQIAHELRR